MKTLKGIFLESLSSSFFTGMKGVALTFCQNQDSCFCFMLSSFSLFEGISVFVCEGYFCLAFGSLPLQVTYYRNEVKYIFPVIISIKFIIFFRFYTALIH